MEKSNAQLPPPETTPYSKYHKICSPTQYFNLFRKITHNKAKLLKQLEQLEIDTTQFKDANIKYIQERCEKLLRSTYSFKYIGIKDNQIGILSKRVRPDKFSADLLPKTENTHVVTGFFYPKPLKTISSSTEKSLTVDNLQNQIKRFFPKHEKKHIDHDVKVKGSWKNLKTIDRSPGHLKLKECNLPQTSTFYNSYSRALQRRAVQQSTAQSQKSSDHL